MKAARTLLSAVCILVSATVVALWGIASVMVNAVDDGTAVRGITERALNSPAVQDSLSDDLTARTVTALREQGLDLGSIGERAVNEAISRSVATEVFRDTVVEQVDDAHAQVSGQLSDPTRQPAPLTVTVNLSESVNARLGEAGGAVAALPRLSLPAVTVEVLDEDRFEQARSAYSGLRWVQQWGLWVGLGVFALGIAISHRRRWFVAKTLLAVGLLTAGVGAGIALMGAESFTAAVAGDGDGAWAILWRDMFTAQAVQTVMTRALWLGGIALLGAAIAAVLAMTVGAKKK